MLKMCNKTTCIYLFNKYNVDLEVSFASAFLCTKTLGLYNEGIRYGR